MAESPHLWCLALFWICLCWWPWLNYRHVELIFSQNNITLCKKNCPLRISFVKVKKSAGNCSHLLKQIITGKKFILFIVIHWICLRLLRCLIYLLRFVSRSGLFPDARSRHISRSNGKCNNFYFTWLIFRQCYDRDDTAKSRV